MPKQDRYCPYLRSRATIPHRERSGSVVDTDPKSAREAGKPPTKIWHAPKILDLGLQQRDGRGGYAFPAMLQAARHIENPISAQRDPMTLPKPLDLSFNHTKGFPVQQGCGSAPPR